MKAMLKYGFVDLVEDTGKWLVIGVFAGGVIGYLVPSNIISRYLGRQENAFYLSFKYRIFGSFIRICYCKINYLLFH